MPPSEPLQNASELPEDLAEPSEDTRPVTKQTSVAQVGRDRVDRRDVFAVLGLVREMVFARYFGAGFIYDAYQVAFRIPNVLRDLFAEGALSAAFVKVFTDYQINKAKRKPGVSPASSSMLWPSCWASSVSSGCFFAAVHRDHRQRILARKGGPGDDADADNVSVHFARRNGGRCDGCAEHKGSFWHSGIGVDGL